MRVQFAAMTAAVMLSATQCTQVQFLSNAPEASPQKEGTAEGAFRMACRGGHLSYDDPIVAPGVNNATHLHQFFGNLDTNENTTDENIRYMSRGSTCQGGRLNGTAYWVPALMDSATQQVVPIDVVIVYYKGEPHHTAGPVQPLPEGIRMISDDGSWSCDGANSSDTIAANCAGQLLATVRFKFCWNGQLDSPDHRSHLASSYYENGVERCPPTHPTVIPRITYNIVYNTTGMGPSQGFTVASDHDPKMTGLSSGQVAPPGSTLHGDYLYGWYRTDNETGKSFARVWYDNCLAGFKNCDFGDLGDGRRLKPWPAEAKVQQPSPALPPLPRSDQAAAATFAAGSTPAQVPGAFSPATPSPTSSLASASPDQPPVSSTIPNPAFLGCSLIPITRAISDRSVLTSAIKQ
jgi:Domain of unknown function (DUF1996)